MGQSVNGVPAASANVDQAAAAKRAYPMPSPKPAKHLDGAPGDQKRLWGMPKPLEALRALGNGAQRAAGAIGGVFTSTPYDGRLTHQQAFNKGPAALKKLVARQVQELQRLEIDMVKAASKLHPDEEFFKNIVDPSQFKHDDPRRWDADMKLDRAYAKARALLARYEGKNAEPLPVELREIHRIAANFDKVDKDSDHNLELIKAVDPQAHQAGQVAAAAYGCLMRLIENSEGIPATDLARFKGRSRFWHWSSTPSPAVAVSISDEILKLLERLKTGRSPEERQQLDEFKAAVAAAGTSWSALLQPTPNGIPPNRQAPPPKSPEEISNIFEMIHQVVEPLKFLDDDHKDAGEEEKGAATEKKEHSEEHDGQIGGPVLDKASLN